MGKYLPEYSIINASIIGESRKNILNYFNYLKTHKISVNTLVIEINLFNFTSSTPNTNKNHSEYLNNSYSQFYLFHPHGINLLTNLELNRLYAPDKKERHRFSFANLPDSYSEKYIDFKKNLPEYASFLNSIFSTSFEIAEHVYFFISPISREGIKQTQFNITDIENELNDLNQICQRYPKIHCLIPKPDYSKNNFMNISHFNEQGHQVISKWLAKQIKKNQKEA
ncbi:hypothetical protein EP47_03120 [Legionella norrlandica]|uniref:Uncharacterized protein n=1 Tax=Legionella norrlandica TaxID=1498499 RepID=A0A0A2T879_9GAMM|nr:hypothetical protein [Legionella norrlandica]KGP63628.1 hypothetical protein EP47_03120 [Legionella norrlandica]